MEIKLVKDILQANEVIAAQNKELFAQKGIYVINLMGGAGAGKTTSSRRHSQGRRLSATDVGQTSRCLRLWLSNPLPLLRRYHR